MIPSSKWFPSSLSERAAWYKNFNTNIQIIGADLGLTPAELATIDDDNNMLQFIARLDVAAGAYDTALREFRRLMTEGDAGTKSPAFPDPLTMTPPANGRIGIYERLDGFVRRVRAAANFTDETNALLGTAPKRYKKVARHLEDEARPEIGVSAAVGNIVLVKFVRHSADGVAIDALLDNDSEWQPLGRFIKSPAKIAIPQNDENLPRSVQIRARFLDGNEPVGGLSSIVTVQTIPR